MTISNTDDVIDSRDVIARIEELRDTLEALREEFDSNPANDGVDFANWSRNQTAMTSAEVDELAALEKLAEEASGSPDWTYGESLIRESYFTDYIEQLIDDCYEMPKELNSGEWPWRHVTVDYEAAAEEAKADYIDCDFDGVTYLIRG
jgi:hypothetical protein